MHPLLPFNLHYKFRRSIYTQTEMAFRAPSCSTVSTVRKPCAYGKFKSRNFPTKPQCPTKTSFERKPHIEQRHCVNILRYKPIVL